MRRRWSLLGGLVAVFGVLVAAAILEVVPRESSATKRQGPAVATDPLQEPTHAALPAVTELLPNLQILPARNVIVDTSGDDRLLRFDSTLVNVGFGPLEVVPQNTPRCPLDQRQVSQVVYTDADRNRRFDRELDRGRRAVASGCMLFHPRHDHWHIDGSAGYALTPANSTEPIVSRSKVSFCLRDSNPLRRGSGAPKHFGECARDRVQGISTGWTDLYDNKLDGQTLRLPDSMQDGDYCLRLRADPRDLFRESIESDNDSAVLIRLRGERVSVLAPRCAA